MSTRMATRCLAFAMLVVAGIVVRGNLPAGISAQTECGGDFSSIITTCNAFFQKQGPEIPPSQRCCEVLKNVDVPCLCKYITPPIEAQISVEKAIYVARTCGCSVPAGIKCGSSLDCGGKNIAYTMTVGGYGKGTFRTIQAAIDSIKNNNDRWVKIHIKAGLYIEKVYIPQKKPCIILEGEGSQSTIISFWDHQKTDISATFTSLPPNVVVTGIAFKNSYNSVKQSYKLDDRSSEPIKPAAAARVYGDKSFFFKCNFIGYQDTLFDVMGRHYFKDCYIQGEVDFIFGGGQSYYENCLINVVGTNSSVPGFVTAQGRLSLDDPSGFVFEGGSLFGVGKVNLGRAWRPYSRVIFHGTNFSSVVTPQGWNAWRYIGQESKFAYAEVDCKGLGADTSKRVTWMKKLNHSQLEEFSLTSFINKDRWVDNLPTIS
ncbi:pectinesterase 55 [Spatholobus suberectus]|nr:pectinesterase 55 [Spatholobus suberectus]